MVKRTRSLFVVDDLDFDGVDGALHPANQHEIFVVEPVEIYA